VRKKNTKKGILLKIQLKDVLFSAHPAYILNFYGWSAVICLCICYIYF